MRVIAEEEDIAPPIKPPTIEAAIIGKPFNIANFISFRQLITPDLIRFGYLFGVLMISIASIYWAFFNPRQTVGSAIAYGGGILIVGNLVWRVLCELYIVMFSIHEALWRDSD